MMCRHHLGETASYFLVREILVPGEGFEPPTFGLQNRCTTTVLTRHRGIGSLFVGYRGLVKHFRIGKMVGQGLPSTQQSAFQSLPNGHLRVLYTVLLHCPALQPSTSTKRRISLPVAYGRRHTTATRANEGESGRLTCAADPCRARPT